MSNYITNVVQANFGTKRVQIGLIVMDDSNTGSNIDTGMNNIDYVAVSPKTAGAYMPHVSFTTGSIAIITAASGSSYYAMIIGR